MINVLMASKWFSLYCKEAIPIGIAPFVSFHVDAIARLSESQRMILILLFCQWNQTDAAGHTVILILE